MVKVSKITKVKMDNRIFYVLEKEDLPDMKGSQEEYLEADKQLNSMERSSVMTVWLLSQKKNLYRV